MFRWGKRVFMRSLGKNVPGISLIPWRLFRRAPLLSGLLAWMAGMAVHDLRQPDSRIRGFVLKALERHRDRQRIRTIVMQPLAVAGPQGRDEQTGTQSRKP
jgi:hypothetical protein